MSNLSTLPKGDSAWLLRKAIERIMEQVSVLETNIGSSTTGNSLDGQIIFNDNGTLRGDTGLTYAKSTTTLRAGLLIVPGNTQLATIGILYVGTTANPRLKVDVGANLTTITNASITGVATFAAGTALLPALTTTGDTNTGIYYPAADTFAVTTGGTERLRVDSTGLGVGVSPSYNIHARGATDGRIQIEGASGFGMVFIQGSSGNSAQLQLNSSGGSGRRFALSSGSSGQFSIADETAALARLAIDSSGNVTVSTGNVVMGTSGKGIDFSAVTGGTGTATANVLNDYEEGNWVPSVGGDATYTLRRANYVKVGRLVTVSWDMEILLIGTGDVSGIISLPFVVGTASGLNNQPGYGACGFFNVLATTVYSMTFYAAANTSTIYAMTKNSLSAGNSVNTAIYGNGSRVQGSLTYMTNS